MISLVHCPVGRVQADLGGIRVQIWMPFCGKRAKSAPSHTTAWHMMRDRSPVDGCKGGHLNYACFSWEMVRMVWVAVVVSG